MKRISFNEDWSFKRAVTNMTEELMGSGDAANAVIAVDLPHDAMIFTRRSPGSKTGPAYGNFEGGDYEYAKTFRAEAEDAGKTFVLEFEGIMSSGRVYVNGSLVGDVRYGYTRLKLDITNYLNYGADNTVQVKVTNSDVPNSRWYTGAGLYRPAWLHVGGPVRVPVDGLRIETPDVAEAVSTVVVTTALNYDGVVRKPITIRTTLRDAAGEIVAAENTKYTLMEPAASVRQRIYVRGAKLWSVEDPNLYTCEVEVRDADDAALDTAASTFGIRAVAINPAEGFKLNGKPVLLRGGCIHHDNGIVGAATFDRAEERRVELLKAAGFNALRISHNPASKALLNACDRLGMLVMEESFDMWTQSKSQFDYALNFTKFWEGDLEDIVAKDYNHPSVVMYSIGNEIQELAIPGGAAWSHRLAGKLRALDGTRLVTNAINGLMSIMDKLPMVMVDLGLITAEQLQAMTAPKPDGDQGDGGINDMMTALLGQMNLLTSHPSVKEGLAEVYSDLDACGFNYMRGVYDIYKDELPNMVFFGSETLPPDIDLNWDRVKAIPACIGDFTWTAWDYIGESGVGVVEYDKPAGFSKPYPVYLAYCGDIDIVGQRRPMSYYREIVFGLRKAPYIAVQLPEHYGQKVACTPWTTAETVASWTWNGFEGKPCKVEVFSDAAEVELLINGKSAGRLPAGEANRFKAVFDVVYEPGTVEAVACYANGETTRFSLRTAGEAVRLSVDTDRTAMAAGDLAYLTFSLTDADGALNTSADRKITLKVEGAGILQGFGSADPRSEENFFDTERMTFRGVAAAAIRAKRKAGPIRVTACAEGCAPVTVELEVK